MPASEWEQNTDFLLIVLALAYLMHLCVIDFATRCATICWLRMQPISRPPTPESTPPLRHYSSAQRASADTRLTGNHGMEA
jgi:hypothetical protein